MCLISGVQMISLKSDTVCASQRQSHNKRSPRQVVLGGQKTGFSWYPRPPTWQSKVVILYIGTSRRHKPPDILLLTFTISGSRSPLQLSKYFFRS